MTSSEHPDGIRLQKVLSQAGVASRRAAEDLIAAGWVEVNGEVVTEQGRRVDPDVAVIHVDGTRVNLRDDLIYLALNKPKGVHSTMSDDRGRPCVGEYLMGRYEETPGVVHVGLLRREHRGPAAADQRR